MTQDERGIPSRSGAAARRFALRRIQLRIVLTLLPAMLPMLAILWVTYDSAADSSLKEHQLVSRLVVEGAAQQMDTFLARQKANFDEWVREDIYGMAIEFDTTKDLGARFDEMMSSWPEVALLALTAPDGRVLLARSRNGDAGSLVSRVTSDASLARAGAGAAVAIGETDLAAAAGLKDRSTLSFAFASRDSTGKQNGALLVYLDWQRIATRVAEAGRKLAESGMADAVVSLVDRRAGRVLAHPDASRVGTPLAFGAGLEGWLGDAANAGKVQPFELEGSTWHAGFAPILDPEALQGGEGTARTGTWLLLLSVVPEENVLAGVNRTLRLSLLLALIGIAALGVLIWMAGGRIAKPIKKTVALIKDVAEGEGDLTKRLEVDREDELGELARWFNAFMEKLQGLIRQVGDTTDALSRSAGELAATSEQMNADAGSTSQQANLVAEAGARVSENVQAMSAGTEEMSASIREIAQNAAEAARVASSAVQVSESANATMGKLGESSNQIGSVIKVITSIAEQTNLLALNATIEAARAGEAGKGFAVVADEVKELAKETAKATEDIGQKVEIIQSDTKCALSAIAQINTIINQITGIQGSIATAVEEQTATTNEIGRSVADAARSSAEIARNIATVAQAAESTKGGATRTESSAKDLAGITDALQALVGQFKT